MFILKKCRVKCGCQMMGVGEGTLAAAATSGDGAAAAVATGKGLLISGCCTGGIMFRQAARPGRARLGGQVVVADDDAVGRAEAAAHLRVALLYRHKVLAHGTARLWNSNQGAARWGRKSRRPVSQPARRRLRF
jgi:hypothetical protein